MEKFLSAFVDDIQLNASNRMQVTGWGCDPDLPAAAMLVDIYASRTYLANPLTQGATYVGNVLANGYNASLANYPQFCARTTFHNFTFVLPNSMHDGSTWYVYSYVRDSAGGPSARLGNTPLSRAFPNLAPLGWEDDLRLNASNRIQVTGWGCDPNSPSTAIVVDVYASRTPLADPLTQGAIYAGNVVANGYNASLANYPQFCAGTTNHNFTLVLPDGLHDGATWYVYSYARDSAVGPATRLGNTPLAVTFPNLAVPYSARYVSDFIPAFFELGVSTQVSITMFNDGSATWHPGEVFLGTQGPQDNIYWCIQNTGAQNRVPVPRDVLPSQTITFTFNVLPGTCGDVPRPLIFKMISPIYGTFGEQTVDRHPVVGSSATFIGVTVPSAMNPGGTAQVSVSFKNTGQETWSSAAGYKLGSQNPQDNAIWGKARVALPGTVLPGQTAVIRFDIKAPAVAGNYSFQWRMLQEGVRWFGQYSSNSTIKVANGSVPLGNLVPSGPPPSFAPFVPFTPLPGF